MASGTTPTFIGRTTELTRLSGLLERAGQGQRAVALLGGEAGVGKTRLLGEFAGHAEDEGALVLTGGCMESGDLGLPYVPFVDAFRDLGSRPGEAEILASMAVVPNLQRLLPTSGERATSPAADREFEQVELFGGIHSLLLRLSESSPLVLVIEDLHWADRSTRDLFSFLARTLRSGRVSLIGSYRSDELHRRHPLRPLLNELSRLTDIERIELRPFGREDLVAHLRALTGGDVDEDAVDRIMARSEGNAFFSEELVAAGAISSDVILPDALADVLRDRIEALPDNSQELLKIVSVAGRRIGHGLLVTASGEEESEIESALREAIAGHVLVADTRSESYRFRHALLQETVYRDLLPGERSRLHRRFAELLSEKGPAAELAHHALASHDLPTALDALVRAADEATSVVAHAEALDHLTQAIELWGSVPDAAEVSGSDRPSLLLRAAGAAGNSGEFRRAAKLASEAVAEIDADKDPLAAALAYERLGEHLYQNEAPRDEILASFRRAVELVPESPPSVQRARVTAGLARALLGALHYTEARRWCDEALTVAREVSAAEEETNAMNTLAVLELRNDNADAARSLLRQTAERAAAIGARWQELRAMYGRGALELDVGELSGACALMDESLELAARSGLTWSQYGINSGVLQQFVYYAAGRWDEAMQLAHSIDDRAPGADNLAVAALFVEIGRGDPRAGTRLPRLEIVWAENDWVAYLGGGCAADLATWEEDLDAARKWTQRSLAALDRADEAWELSAIWPAALALAAEADYAERGRLTRDQAGVNAAVAEGESLILRCRTADQNARSVGRQIGPEARAWLTRAEAEWARLSGHSEPELWEAAAEAFGYGYVYEEARSRRRLAEALLANNDREGATEALRAAHVTARRLGAEPLLAAIDALARRGRLDVGTPPARDEVAGLTPRELEVLRLVSLGRSNQQIADELFISRKTASVHVSHILGKLDVQSRVEAAAVAHRLGLGATTLL